MCKQADEEFLTSFKAQIKTEWDVTNLHINKLDMEGVKKDLDHYWDTYKKPMWVTEVYPASSLYLSTLIFSSHVLMTRIGSLVPIRLRLISISMISSSFSKVIREFTPTHTRMAWDWGRYGRLSRTVN